MGACIGGFVLLYSVGYMAHDKSATRFYVTMLVFIGGFITLVYSANLFIFYLCWELVGLCSFTLVGFWYTNREAVNGARKVLLMTHIAGYGLLAGILVLYHRAGSALWTDPAVARSFTGGIFALMLVALVAKSVQVPLHTWIPEAMAAPTPVSALLHAACYVTSGVYLAARMHSFGSWPAAWGESLMWVGTVTIAVGVMYAMVQTDLKRMLAFSTVSQIGYMMMGLGIGTPLAITAALLHCLNHGFFKGGLFLTAGSVQHAAGTRDMNQLGGLAAKMPQTTLSWLIGVGSMMGIPLMSGFASKWMLYAAALQAGWAVPAVIAWAASLGTVFLGVKATSAVFLGPPTESTEDAHEAPPSMVWGMGFLAAGTVVLGVAPQLAVNYLLNPVLAALGMGAGVHVTWLGLSADAGSFSSAGGLVLALVSVILGGAIYLIAYAFRPVTASSGAAMAGAGGGVFTGGEPLGEQGRLTAGDFSEIFEEHWRSFFRWTNVDKAFLWFWSGFQALSSGLGAAVGWMERRATLLLAVLAAVIFVLARWIVPATAVRNLGNPELIAFNQIPALLIAAIGIAVAALLLAALSVSAQRMTLLMLVVGGLTVDGLLVANSGWRLGILETAALLTVLLVWQTARSQAAKLTYLTVVLISAASTIAGDICADHGSAAWARALLLTGIFVKLAAVPMFFWLLALADEVPALVLGLIIAIVDMAAFGEFLMSVQAVPSLLTPQPLFFYATALTSLLAALLMITQRSLKRLLVLSTIEDVGFLLLGVASANAIGLQGAIIAASTHALAKALLFICLAAPEADGALHDEPLALAARYPVSAFGFLFGMLAMLGVPPTMGYLGRWRLYSTALGLGRGLLVVFMVSSILALIAYTLALTRNWWGPPGNFAPSAGAGGDARTTAGLPPQRRGPVAGDPGLETGATAREPWAIKAVIVLLVVILLAAGIWPHALQMLMGVRP
jgi:multicomponent Na+:H+ antiporter subunit A